MSLPQELVDYVIDFLYDDPVSLSSCSLVSRAWVDESRCHLWQKITVTVITAPLIARPSLDEFVSCLSGPPSVNHGYRHPGHFIQHFSLKKDKALKFAKVDIARLFSVLASLPNLKSLSLIYIRFILSQPIDTLPQPFVSLERLYMEGVFSEDLVGDEIHPAAAFWRCFTNISVVQCKLVYGHHWAERDTGTITPAPQSSFPPLVGWMNTVKVRHIDISGTYADNIRPTVTILRLMVDLKSVTSFLVEIGWHRRHYRFVGKLMQDCENLKSVSLIIKQPIGSRELPLPAWAGLFLGHTAIQRVVLKAGLYLPDDRAWDARITDHVGGLFVTTEQWSSIPLTLAGLASANCPLQELEICLLIPEHWPSGYSCVTPESVPTALMSMDWDTLAETVGILARAVKRKLKLKIDVAHEARHTFDNDSEIWQGLDDCKELVKNILEQVGVDGQIYIMGY